MEIILFLLELPAVATGAAEGRFAGMDELAPNLDKPPVLPVSRTCPCVWRTLIKSGCVGNACSECSMSQAVVGRQTTDVNISKHIQTPLCGVISPCRPNYLPT